MDITEIRTSNRRLFYYGSDNIVTTKQLWGTVWVVSAIIFAAIQFLLGTDSLIVGLAFISLLFCAIPLFFFGINDICAVFIIGLLSKYSFFPLWIKTFLGERIDLGLNAPLRTFEMTLVGSVICCLALLFVKFIPVKHRLLNYHISQKQMVLAGYISTVFGLLFLTLHVIFSPVVLPGGEITPGFGGFGSLVGPLYFGICCITVISFKPNANPIHKFFLILVLITILGLSLQTNAKAQLTLAVLTLLLTFFYFRIKIKARYILYCCFFVAFYAFVFSPVIHLTRTEAFKTANFIGKISIIENLFNDKSLLDLNTQSNEIFNYPYYPTIHTFLIDRLEMTQDMDIASGGITDANTIGWLPIRRAFEASLPSFIIQNKSNISDIDLIAFNAGYYPILTTLNHTIGVFGSAYAMFLWPGLVIISLLIIFLYLFLLRLIVSPKLSYNPFGIFLLGAYGFTFSEQSVQALLITIIRSIPIDAFLVLGIVFLVFWFLPNPFKHH